MTIPRLDRVSRVRRGRKGYQAGVSAVEMLVGLVLGVIVLGGASTIYIASKTSYIEVEQNSVLTENSLFTERFLTDAVRHVGFLGEVQAGRIEQHPDLSAVAGDCTGDAAAYAVENYLVAAVADLNGDAFGCVTDAVPGSHVLVVKSVVPQPFSDGPRRSADRDPDNALHSDGVISELIDGQTYIMTNNMVGILFDDPDTAPTIGIGGEVPGGVAWAYRFEVLYIRSGRTPQLSRKTLRNVGGVATVVTEDLVLGVEDMRLRMGMDGGNDGDVDNYRDITAVAGNWDAVQSMEISLLLRSPSDDQDYLNTKTYKMAGSNVTRNDHYRRIMVSTSVSLRNPKLVIRGDAV